MLRPIPGEAGHARLRQRVARATRQSCERSRPVPARVRGHGTWEFYRLDEDLLVVTCEALIGIHVRMSDRLQIDMPNRGAPLISVGQAAHAVGYRHQTSFTAAFAEFCGFLLRNARTQVH